MLIVRLGPFTWLDNLIMFATIEIIIDKPFGLHPTIEGITKLEKENQQDTR